MKINRDKLIEIIKTELTLALLTEEGGVTAEAVRVYNFLKEQGDSALALMDQTARREVEEFLEKAKPAASPTQPTAPEVT